jgi:hypothetical protein
MSHTTNAAQMAVKLLLLAGFLTLQGCSREIDVRQSHVEQGLIYKKDASDPFSGTLNNVGAVEVLKRYTAQFQLFAATCMVPVQEGLFDGVAVCKDAKGTKVAEVKYGKGQVDGAFKVWAADTGKLMMSTTIRGGETDGTEEYYNSETGKVISRVSYQAGKHVGEEKHWDIAGETLLTDLVWQDGKKTGVYRSPEREEHYKAGIYDGTWKMCWWSDSVPLAKRQAYEEKIKPLGGRYFIPAVVDNPADAKCTETVYADGVKQAAAVANAAPGSGDACLDAKIAAFRKENGEEAPVNNDVIQEWEASCKK